MCCLSLSKGLSSARLVLNILSRVGKLAACGLKKGDAVHRVLLLAQDQELLMIGKNANAIRFSTDSIPQQGRTAAGVKAMALETGDEVLFADLIGQEQELALFTERGYAKRLPIDEIEPQKRNGKGQRIIALQKDGANGNELVFICWFICRRVLRLRSFMVCKAALKQCRSPKRPSRERVVLLCYLCLTM